MTPKSRGQTHAEFVLLLLRLFQNMPSQTEIETALKANAVDGKIKVKDVLTALPVLGIATDKVEPYLEETKDGDDQVNLAEIVAYISSI
ncbi:unnamed protein product [Rodentolepis nana]|uniref:EF-hand domain-containing protein n=1 Tax=Rodentolepis nana TaxID=102285 RepID=A0A0R3TUL6_RODNA|nr:unnamed protein product [Rodentolepis nana]